MSAVHRKPSLWEIRQPIPRGLALGLGFVMPALVLLAWCVISYGGLAPPDFLPSPTEVIRGTLQLFLQYDLSDAILVSTRRIVLAFLLAAALALPLGILMGAFAPMFHIFESNGVAGFQVDHSFTLFQLYLHGVDTRDLFHGHAHGVGADRSIHAENR